MFQRKLHPRPVAPADRDKPPWRLLIESSDPAAMISDFTAFRDAGFQITLCEGPIDEPGDCPAVRGAVCPLLAEADVALFEPDADRPWRSEVLAALRVSRPDLPLVVRLPSPASDSPAGCSTIPTTTSVHGQVQALRKAVERSARRS